MKIEKLCKIKRNKNENEKKFFANFSFTQKKINYTLCTHMVAAGRFLALSVVYHGC